MRGVDDGWRGAARAAAVPWLASRGLALVAGYLAARLVGYEPLPVEQAAWRESSGILLNLPARWDAFWYLDIARHGYQWDPGSISQQNVVYFPAYPVLVRAAGWLLGGNLAWAGALVSLAAFYPALVVLRRLAAREIGPEAAERATWLAAAYPFALFYGAAYTESLFLLALVSAFWCARAGRSAWLAAWGTLLGLTRPNGWWMALPLLWVVAARSWEPVGLEGHEPPAGRAWLPRGRAWAARLDWRTLAAACTPLAGTVAFSIYLWSRFGDPLAWLEGQRAWGTILSPAPLDLRWGPPMPGRPSDAIVIAGNLAALAFAALAVRPVWRRVGPPYVLVVLCTVGPAVVTHGIQSMGRYTAILFPLFFWLAAGPAASRPARWVAWFAFGQAVAAALFYSWRPMV